jgi:hypothetical protein
MDVAQEAFETFPSPCHAAFLLDACGVAEFDVGCPAGCGWREAGIDLLLAAEVKVETHFFVDIGVELTAVEEHAQAAKDFGGFAHLQPPVFLLSRESGSLDYAGDGAYDALELGELDAQLLSAVGGEGVVAGAAVAGGDTPLGGDPAFDEHALEGRVEGAFFDLEDLV